MKANDVPTPAESETAPEAPAGNEPAESGETTSVDASAAEETIAIEEGVDGVTPDNATEAEAPPEKMDAAGGQEAIDETVSVEDLLPDAGSEERAAGEAEDARLKAIIEAVVYITDEPLTSRQIAEALDQPAARVEKLLAELTAEYSRPERGLTIRELAGGYKMGTKPEHHEAIRTFVKKLTPPLKLSMAALETLAVIAYKQPITAPEIMEIRGVQGAGVLKTLLDRKLITAAGRKAVIGRPVLYKTTKDFLVQFGLKELGELPTLKEFEELARLALTDSEPEAEPKGPQPETSSPPADAGAEPATESSHG
ncbi:MAG: SMC-Scp complex subunit ScpB [Bryobacteraceae bacterium]|nr:SMC-Scp complex subunit ScpB [Bryobacteraceae bacterium]